MRRIAAAITFFTRIPLWRWIQFPAGAFDRIVSLWPLVGWLTGGLAAGVLLLAGQWWSLDVAVVLALASRVVLTGGLHDDGFADFCDAFGGNNSRERTLEIMKDSHIGTYGVLGLLFYYLIYYAVLASATSVEIAAALLFASDGFSKLCSAQIINLLPYARAEGPKNRIHYARMNWSDALICIVTGLLPLLALTGEPLRMLAGCLASAVTALMMIWWMHRRLGGYTGDCCGATFMASNLAFTLAALTAS